MTMAEPDELYTLRAQFALGHYGLALQESKQVARRPLSAALQAEREEYTVRALTALRQYSKIEEGDRPALQALCLKAKYEAATGNPSQQGPLLDQLKSLASSAAENAVVQLTVAQVLMMAGDLTAAYPMVAAVHKKLPEAWACQIQILLQWSRLDLAQKELKAFQSTFEESVVAELANIYVQLFLGSTGGAAAEHSITALSEQYGPSVYLLNLMAAAHAVQGDYAASETKLLMATADFSDSPQPETAVNAIVINAHLNKPYDLNAVLLDKKSHTSLQFSEGWHRVTTAFDREAAKYKL